MAEPESRDPRAATPPPSAAEDLRNATRRKGSFLHTVQAVAWSFLGIRKGSGYEQDVSRLNPVHVILAGLIGAALFVGALVLLVSWIASSAAGPT
ncbi:hypothetical protein C7444_10823 [Sphaerotilus hippei]|uniref:DUF2970 family protein n=1 Tax=Sphaerotilus hippei TaxID=744406 RepID=A0A318GZJ8_9BURK|nr:DUF2970 domain-containing protein [Sphaerotilus hippei]PXW95765.1 hypothetical protein C7444_10823 [Sphaerotilus hippei]